MMKQIKREEKKIKKETEKDSEKIKKYKKESETERCEESCCSAKLFWFLSIKYKLPFSSCSTFFFL